MTRLKGERLRVILLGAEPYTPNASRQAGRSAPDPRANGALGNCHGARAQVAVLGLGADLGRQVGTSATQVPAVRSSCQKTQKADIESARTLYRFVPLLSTLRPTPPFAGKIEESQQRNQETKKKGAPPLPSPLSPPPPGAYTRGSFHGARYVYDNIFDAKASPTIVSSPASHRILRPRRIEILPR